MRELDTTTIVRRSIQGVLALSVRTAFIQAINFLSFFLLSIFLETHIIGAYFIVSAVIAFLVYFSDIGLAAALIQKKEEITHEDLKTAFTIQQGLILLVVIIAVLGSNFIASFYDLDKPGIWLFQALVFSFFLSSLKTIPSVLLERKLEFQKLIIPQIVETIVFNTTSVTLALLGFGITSFTFAVLARGIVGVLAMYIISPWKPSLGIEEASAKRLLSFGLPFQVNSVLALFKDDFLTIVLGKILTFSQVGYIGFSQKWAYAPLRLALDNIVRITFPSFSRLQDDKRALRRALEKSLFMIATFVTPLLVGFVVLSPYLVTLIPKYVKWEPALPSLAFFSANALLSSISTPLTNFLNAIGKIKVTLLFMVFWTLSTWATTLIAIQFFGFTGVSIASFVVSLSVVWVVIITRRYVAFDIFKAVSAPFLSGAVMGGLLYVAAPFVVSNFLMLLVAAVASGLFYLFMLYTLSKNELQSDIRVIRRILRRET